MNFLSQILKFSKISPIERLFVIKALITCIIISPLTRFIGPKYYIRILTNYTSIKNIDSQNPEFYIKLLKLSIRRVAKILPWRLTCLDKSICFKILANALRLNCFIVFNVINMNGRLWAHSSVKCNNQIVYLNNNYMGKFNSILNL
jgi:hypothetical protein